MPAVIHRYARPDVLRVFLLGEVSAAEARNYAVSMAEHADADLARYRQIRDSIEWGEPGADFFSRAALEYGLRNAAMEAEWARWLVAELDQT